MSLPRRRVEVKRKDRSLERSLGIRRNDPVADRLAGGNVYSSADIEMLEREKTSFWRRPRRVAPE